MKSIVRFALAAGAVAACAVATAAPFDSADQQRRDRNREEILARRGAEIQRDVHRRRAYPYSFGLKTQEGAAR